MPNTDTKTTQLIGGAFPIVRDPNFIRTFGDAFIPYPFADALDLSVLVASPEIEGQHLSIGLSDEDKSDATPLNPVQSYAEVVRLRLDRDAVHNLLSVTLAAALSHNLVEYSVIRDIVAKYDTGANRSGGNDD